MSYEHDPLAFLSHAHVGVLGLGISNLPLIDFLLAQGVTRITARDRMQRSQASPEVLALERAGVRLLLGEEHLSSLEEDILFRSPGIRPDLPPLADFAARGGIVTSEMELFFRLTPARIFAVTGSDGKTTTTTLTHLFLQGAFPERTVYVGGNIGTPLLPRVREMTGDDIAVLELSSFQLQTPIGTPTAAAITNITPNHLNWHTDYAEYKRAKEHLIQKAPTLVLNAENEETASLALRYPHARIFSSKRSAAELRAVFGARICFTEENGQILCTEGEVQAPLFPTEAILLPGRHNVENYLTACALTYPLVPPEVMLRVASSFRGVAHRLEYVRTVNGVRYYNSSIDSSPNRTRSALYALQEKPIVICGGASKGIPFDLLAEVLWERAKAVVLTGDTAEEIARAILSHPNSKTAVLPIYRIPDFADAVRGASALASEGDTVLLSPACTSFDRFRNFEERGNTFKEIVRSLDAHR